VVVNWAKVYNLLDAKHKSMEYFNLSRANLWDNVYQNHIPEVIFKLLYNVSRDNLNYTKPHIS
jgi:hypothetical protein